jgi:hypothetical protein
MRYVALLAAALLIGGCSIPRSVKEGGPISGQVVNLAGKVLILNVANGQEQGQPVANGSGQGMVSALRTTLSTHGIPLSTTEEMDLSSGFDEAQKGNFVYVLKCAITLWQDNATAWSGNGDKLSITVELYDAKTRQLVAAASHQRVATGATFVSGSPDRFMGEVATGALSQIYGWPQKQ